MEKDIIELIGLLIAYDIPFVYDEQIRSVLEPKVGGWQCEYTVLGFTIWNGDRFLNDGLSPKSCIYLITRLK